MAEPWLSIIGLGEDGLAGLSEASRNALTSAEIVFGGPRHLALAKVRGQAWPLPFSVAPVLAHRGRRVAVLASGDPFWHGVGGSLAQHLSPEDWQVYPAPSTFSLVAARLGWRLEEVLTFGLHAAPFERLRPVLAQGQRFICLLRDGFSARDLAAYLTGVGFGASMLHVMQDLGGPPEHRFSVAAQHYDTPETSDLVCVGIEAVGQGIPRSSGLADDLFDHDGQITKRPARALTLSALAPRPGEVLWDIGTGSGSVAIEFLLAAPASTAHAVEADATRGARALQNALRFGLGHRFHLTTDRAPGGLAGLPDPDVVFIGGGLSETVLTALWARLRPGARLVANAVTLESEAVLISWHGRHGGSLLRIELAEAAHLGSRTGWQPLRPLVQWSVTR
jgi:precorrin-6B C5,15-methyltransferase / cobalt-precorrin-6B C5,C15-methyltransferase